MHHEANMMNKQHIAKAKHIKRLRECFSAYSKFAIVNAENVNATQLDHIRHDLAGHAEVLFGKNSLFRRAIEEHKQEDAKVGEIIPFIKNGAAFIFTNGSLSYIKEVIDRHCVGSPAKVGAISPCDVIIPPMKTNMSPNQVNVLHTLGIQSKIFKGTIEITSEKILIKEGEKVGASEANLLSILAIMPFKYTLKIQKLYANGNIYEPAILDISDAVLQGKFNDALRNVAGLALGIGYPCAASGHHLVSNAFKDIASIAVAVEYSMRQIADIQALLADPEALARLNSASAAPAAAAEEAATAKEESDDAPMDLGMDDLFG